MKPEPLDGKRKTIFGERIRLGVNEGVIFINFPFIELDYFEFDDVKSAVLGLKEELNEEKERLNRVYKEFGDKKDLHLSHGISFALECIDKWLKGVIEE